MQPHKPHKQSWVPHKDGIYNITAAQNALGPYCFQVQFKVLIMTFKALHGAKLAAEPSSLHYISPSSYIWRVCCKSCQLKEFRLASPGREPLCHCPCPLGYSPHRCKAIPTLMTFWKYQDGSIILLGAHREGIPLNSQGPPFILILNFIDG